MGTASFMSSEGWMRTPTLSQRVAPLTVTPKKCVRSSSTQPTMKIGTVAFWKAFTGMQDTTSMTTPATAMLRICPSMRHGKL